MENQGDGFLHKSFDIMAVFYFTEMSVCRRDNKLIAPVGTWKVVKGMITSEGNDICQPERYNLVPHEQIP
jgi:hypothetical protein